MCNAWNHDPGCACGFGEPAKGVAHIVSQSEWPEDVQDEPVLLRLGLRELGWGSNEIAEFIHSVDALESAVQDRVDRIRRVLSRYRMEEIDHHTETIDVPIFRFSVPKVARAEITYYESESSTGERQLNLKIFGTGTGGSKTLEVERSATYLATAGDCKVVTVPIRMRVARVKTLHGNRYMGDGVRAEVVVPKAGPRQLLRGRGCKSLKDGSCREPGSDPVLDQVVHNSARDSSGAIHQVERRWAVDYTNEISLTFSKVVKFGPLVRSSRRSEVKLAFQLPSGHNYEASIHSDRLRWKIPRN